MEISKQISELFQKYKAITKEPVSAAILTRTQIQREVIVYPPDEITDDPEMLTVKQAAEIVKCSTDTIYLAVKKGKLRSARFGMGKRSIRIARAAVDEYLKDQPPKDDGKWEKPIWR